MQLHHYTSMRHLSGIARYGLTVGDVPTDLRREKGRVGVWFTSDPLPNGHGLDGSAVDKRRMRLTVRIPPSSEALHKWTTWAVENVTAETIGALHTGQARFNSWYVFFGIVPVAWVTSCIDMQTNASLEAWPNLDAGPDDVPGVSSWRRDAWHRALLKKVRRHAERRMSTSVLNHRNQPRSG